MTQINQAFADKGINIAAQYLQTNEDIGYVVVDVEAKNADEAFEHLMQIEGTIKTRMLHW
jgi:D-3-phosphoglycerate dehydrogenase